MAISRRFPELSLLVRAGLREYLRRRWQLLLALTGITLGVGIVLAVDLANQSASASFEASAKQLSGQTTHRIRSRLGQVDERVYTSLALQADSPAISPLIQGSLRLDSDGSTRLRLVGIDLFAEFAFERFDGQLQFDQGSLRGWLAEPGRIALNSRTAQRIGVAVGDSLRIRRHGHVHELVVHQVFEQGGSSADDLVVADIATAQEIMALSGYLSHIDVMASTDEAEALRQKLPPGLELRTVEADLQGVKNLSATFELNLTAMSFLALLVGMFLIFNAMTLSLLQRRLLLGRLRAVGVTPARLFRGILIEAAILGLIGTVIGLVFGLIIGQGLTRLVAATVNELYYRVAVDAMSVEAVSLIKALALGVLATLVAAALPAWQAANTTPLTVLSRASLEATSQRMVAPVSATGFVLILLGAIIAYHGPSGVFSGFLGLFLTIVGGAMLTPLVLRLIRRVFGFLSLPLIPRMVGRSLDRNLSRLGVAVAALAVALAAGISVGTMVDSMRNGVTQWLHGLVNAPLYLGTEDFADGSPLPEGLTARLMSLEEVGAVSRYRHRKVDIDGRSSTLVATDLAVVSREGFELLDSDHPTTWQGFDDGQVLVSEPLGYRLGIGVGDQLTLPTPNGFVSLNVAATFRDYANEHGRVFIKLDTYWTHWGEDRRFNSMAVLPARGVDDDEMVRAVERELATESRVELTPSGRILEESLGAFHRTFRVTEALRHLATTVAFIGVFSALMALQLERRKEFAVLRALGLRRSQLGLFVALESATLGLAAALIAVPLGLVMAWMLITSIQKRAFGWGMPFDIDPSLLGQTLILGIAAAFLAALYPAWKSARQAPAAQMRED